MKCPNCGHKVLTQAEIHRRRQLSKGKCINCTKDREDLNFAHCKTCREKKRLARQRYVRNR